MKTPIRVEDFSPIAPLAKAYELQPGKHYLVIFDGKAFSFELAYKLLGDLRDHHPELDVFMFVTPNSNKISVAQEKENDSTQTSL